MTEGSTRAGVAPGGARGSLDPDAFAARFEDAFRGLWCIAVAIVGDRHLAEDVLQEAAVIALGKLDRFDPDTSFAAWMGQIVRYTALNHGRRRQRTGARGGNALEPEAASPPAPSSPVTGAGGLLGDQAAFDDAVTDALHTLEPTARACLLLRTVADLPYQEISLALGIPEGTAMSHVHRSRHRMRTLLVDGDDGDA